MANMALMVTGAISTGGLTALVVKTLHTKVGVKKIEPIAHRLPQSSASVLEMLFILPKT
jgi:hypothetical protein